MENVRAYAIINNLKGITEDIYYTPENLLDSDADAEIIRKEGFNIWFKADSTYEEMQEFFMQIIFLKKLELIKLDDNKEVDQLSKGTVNPRIDLSDTGLKLYNKDPEAADSTSSVGS
jgi:two-component system chemotaxis sensor kinase CheA